MALQRTKKIDAYIITLVNDKRATVMSRMCLQSIDEFNCEVDPFILPASTPDSMTKDLLNLCEDDIAFDKDVISNSLFEITKGHDPRIKYTWPVNPADNILDLKTGLQLNAYRAKDHRKIIACAVSHMRAWTQCIKTNRPILVLEHDAEFFREFAMSAITKAADNSKTWGVLGINGAQAGQTRRANVYSATMDKFASTNKAIMPVPSVQGPGEPPVPQGLAGNSAYVIKPWAARELIEAQMEHGIWPNDALMCKELFPWIRQLVVPVTKIQVGSVSTTTG